MLIPPYYAASGGEYTQKRLKLKRKEFSRNSGIPYSTVIDITKGLKLNPTINNILKIANYFKCSIDEVIGRNEYITSPNNEITSEEIIANIKKFLKDKVIEQNINLYKLSQIIGFSNNSLHSFVNSNRGQKTLNSQIVVALADYFQVSLDEMVGRVAPTKDTDSVKSSEQNFSSCSGSLSK
ncbi:MAG: helix-turn-helix domain-containing protein [Rickettsia endosymbiont of Bryobia graminum]|nr:helix-turn-helix domain-containing protein [Rickettsia endosymbiont of Bryobia graminum]